VVMDAYNANPTSMSLAIKNFRNICKSDNLLILGDMRELGEESEREHKMIIELLKELKFKNVYLVGNEFSKSSENSEFSSFNNVEELAQYLQKHPVSGYDILVKGSNSVHLNKIIDSL
ncbi:MAG: UDP-N-acetylmuramoyl-tripeptide--D-alanyl-D-alanine ligase, partial [Bacteroidales bacterium]|nr:UDP-N-acetylmuramoyl-tripeptide--D-alanyl-D-alanine ligase [Bacteroidales bacterium]